VSYTLTKTYVSRGYAAASSALSALSKLLLALPILDNVKKHFIVIRATKLHCITVITAAVLPRSGLSRRGGESIRALTPPKRSYFIAG